MIRIAISAEAFEAIAASMALGSVGYEPQPNENGERPISLRSIVARGWEPCADGAVP